MLRYPLSLIDSHLGLLAAKFKVDVVGYTAEDDDLTCVNLEIDFRPKFPHFW